LIRGNMELPEFMAIEEKAVVLRLEEAEINDKET
jgi:hypothetical protein